MRVRAKVSLAIGVSVLFSGAAICYFAAVVLMRSFLRLESVTVERNVRRAHDALRESESRLDEKLSDWAAWDATCDYASDHNEKFRDENLLPESYRRLGVSLIAILDAQHSVVWAKELPEGADEFVDASDDLLAQLRPGMPLAAHASADSHVLGFVAVGGKLLQAASRPILTSEGEGPPHGTIVFATWIGPERVDHFARLTHLDLDIREGVWIAGPERAGDAALGRSSADRIAGSLVVSDLNSRPVTITVRMNRDIYSQGRDAIAQLLLLMCGQVVLLATLVLSILRRSVLSRLESLAEQARDVREGREHAASIHLSGSDELSELSGVLRDVLEKLDRARLAAEGSSRAKSAILANVSHELRTPMTAIMGFADLLMEADVGPKEREDFARRIRSGAEHLLAVINDLLDTSKIEAGAMTLESLDVSPGAVVQEAASLIRHKAESKGLRLEVVACSPIPRVIRTDPTRLRQVVLNLVGNAVKFTEHGGVRVELEALSGAHRRLEIRVRDTGVGIAPASLSRLFRPFSQADASVTRKFGGTGLGLAISRNLIELMGGRVEVASVLGAGSTFTVVLPLSQQEAQDLVEDSALRSDGTSMARVTRVTSTPSTPSTPGTPAASLPQEAAVAPLQGTRILLVEDGPDNQRLVTHLLRRAGAEVVVAENGRLGVEAVRTNGPFHVVLMDMQMPEMDGYAATRELRRAGEMVPVIAFSAHGVAEERRRCLDAGCDDQIPKPVQREELVRACAAWASRARRAA